MKVFLFFLVIVLLAGLGGGAWFYLQQTEELNQTRTTLSGLNESLISLQDQLATEQANASSILGQLATEKARAAGLESQLSSSNSRGTSLQTELDASRARISALETELAAVKTSLTGTQTEIAAELARVTAELAKSKADLATAIGELEELSAATTGRIEQLTAELRKIKDPRHFYTIEELTAWLAADDTNTNPAYASLGLAEKAFILEVKALRDGYLLPASVDADNQYIYSWNTAIIGAGIYVVTAGTDQTLFLANFDTPPPQRPLPLG